MVALKSGCALKKLWHLCFYVLFFIYIYIYIFFLRIFNRVQTSHSVDREGLRSEFEVYTGRPCKHANAIAIRPEVYTGISQPKRPHERNGRRLLIGYHHTIDRCFISSTTITPFFFPVVIVMVYRFRHCYDIVLMYNFTHQSRS